MPPAWPESCPDRLPGGAAGPVPDGRLAAGPGGRRFLIAGAVSRYSHAPSWNQEKLAGDLDRMVGLFTAELGYQHVPWLGLDPSRSQIRDVLRGFCTAAGRQADDLLAVYLAGHGDVLPAGGVPAEHGFLPADATPADPRRWAVRMADLAGWILAGTQIRRLLLMIDASYCGPGGPDFTHGAASWAGDVGRAAWPPGSGMVVVSAARPVDQSVPGAFSAAFVRAVRRRAASGKGMVTVDAVVSAVNEDPQLPAAQRAAWSLALGSGEIPDFLQPPGRETAEIPAIARQLNGRRQRQHEKDRRAGEMIRQFAPRARGFTGRRRALARIAGWLAEPSDSRPLVVTGDPGSGKTAVLGLLAMLSDPRHRPAVPHGDLPPGVAAAAAHLSAAICAGGMSSGQVLAGIAAAAGLDGRDAGPADADLAVARLIAGLRRREQPLAVIIDAVDEAADPRHLAGHVLGPLIEHGGCHIRLLLGARRHVCLSLSPAWPAAFMVIDLDAPEYADREAMAAVVRRALRGERGGAPPSPFADCASPVLRVAAAAITDAAGQSFLVARLLAAAQARQPQLPETASARWRAGLPGHAGEAMMTDLRSRLGADAGKAADLLRPLAYARGQGLPWEDVWPAAATALATRPYTSEDLLWLADRAGSYVTESGSIDGRQAYRLYHEALAGSLREGRDQRADEAAIAGALAGLVPAGDSGQLRWDAAHPYALAHLADHAAAGGVIDALAQDPGFLLGADPAGLPDALARVSEPAARAAATAYRHARPFLRRSPPGDRAAYLALSARCEGAPGLAARISAGSLARSWRPVWASWQPRQRDQVIGGHDGPVTSITMVEADGCTLIASGGGDGTVRLWDLRTGIPACEPMTGHRGAVTSLAAGRLPGRPILISGGDDGTVRAWDPVTAEPACEPMTGHAGAVRSVAAAQLGGRLVAVSGGADGTVRRWDAGAGAPLGAPLEVTSGWVMNVTVCDAAGQAVIICCTDAGAVHSWDLAVGQPRWQLARAGEHPSLTTVTSLAGQPVVITGGEDGTIRLTSPDTGNLPGRRLPSHQGWVTSMAAGQAGGRHVLASAGSDGAVRIWSLPGGEPVDGRLAPRGSAVLALAVTSLDSQLAVVSGSDDGVIRTWLAGDGPDGRHHGTITSVAIAARAGRPVVLSGSSDCTVRLWDLATGQPVTGGPVARHASRVRAVAAAALGGRPVMVSGGDDHAIMIWDMESGEPVGKPLAGHRGAVTCVAVAKAAGRPVIVSGSADGTVMVWDMESGEPVGKPLAGHRGAVTCIAVAEVGRRPVIVSGSTDGTIVIWDMQAGEPVGKPLTGHEGWVLAVTITEVSGRQIAVSAGDEGTIRNWDLAAGQPAGLPVISHDSAVYCLSPVQLVGRSAVVAGSDDGTVCTWDLAAGRLTGPPLAGPSGLVLAVAAGHLDDGRAVAVSAGSDESISIWDLSVMTAMGEDSDRHAAAVNAVAVACGPDSGAIVVTASSDKTLRSWDAIRGTPAVGPMSGHAGAVRSVATGLAGGRLIAVSGSDDGTARAWDLADGEPVGKPACHDPATVLTTETERDGRPLIFSGSTRSTGCDVDPAAGSMVPDLLPDPFSRSIRAARDLPGGQPASGPPGHGSERTERDSHPLALFRAAMGAGCDSGAAPGSPVGEMLPEPSARSVRAVAMARRTGRPAFVSGGANGTIRVWDLESGEPVGRILGGHDGAITALAAARQRGRAAIVSGTARGTIRVWDLEAGEPAGEPYSGALGPVTALAVTRGPRRQAGRPVVILAGAGSQVTMLGFSPLPGASSWSVLAAHWLPSRVLALAWNPPASFIAGTERGTIAIDTSAEHKRDAPANQPPAARRNLPDPVRGGCR